MGGLLCVDPYDYAAASRTIGANATATMVDATAAITDGLSGCRGMAGTDPVGARWAGTYDDAAAALLNTLSDCIDASLQLAGLLEVSGFNYALAESASTIGGGGPPPLDRCDYAHQHISVCTALPPAAGTTAPSPPAGWHLVAHVVGRVWPNGHQGRLRTAADAWNDAAARLADASFLIADGTSVVARQQAPETDTAIDVCNGLRDQVDALTDDCRMLADACTDYTTQLDHAHSRIEHQLTDLLAWTAGIEGVGALASVLTFGGAEVPTQAEEVSRIAATAARIATVIDELGMALSTARSTVLAVLTRTADTAAALKPLLNARPVMAAVESVHAADEALDVAATAERITKTPVANSFRTPELLAKHFKRHCDDFGVTTAEDYARRARRFFRYAIENGLPRKIDRTGRIRLYDPATNTFGSYDPDGTIVTFFKPTSPTYWARQRGN